MKWVIWALASAFYLYEFFIRVSPSVMVPELMRTFSVDAAAVGSLSAFYFYIYAPLQLPVGVLTDRFGARKLLSMAAFAAGIGTVIFGLAPTYWIAAAGRIFMGFGSAFGFVGMVYICSHWFEESKRGIMIGMGSTIGMFGAILGQGPLRIGIDTIGWRPSIFIMAVFAFILSALIYLLVRNDPTKSTVLSKEQKHSLLTDFLKNLKVVCRNPHSWLNASMGLLFYISTAVFAGLWGIPFLHSTYGMTTKLAGFIISMVFVGWAVGGPLIGIYSDRIKQKQSILCAGALFAFFLMSTIIYVPLSMPLLFILLFLLGFVSAAELLCFSYAIDVNPSHAKATATAFTNFSITIGVAVLQPVVGVMLDTYWSGQMAEGIRVYSPQDFKVAMACFPLSLLLAFVLGLFLKRESA